MAIALLDDATLLKLDLMIPRWGLWHADAQLEGTAAPVVGSRVSLVVGGVSRSGTVTRSSDPYGQARCRIVAGNNGLETKELKPRDYGQVTASQIVADILADSDEATGDLSALGGIVTAQWQRSRERAWQTLQYAMRQAPSLDVWCEHDGRVSVRETTWTTSISALWRGIIPQEKGIVLFGDTGDIEPGVRIVTLQGNFDAERVQYVLDPDDDRSALKINAWYV